MKNGFSALTFTRKDKLCDFFSSVKNFGVSINPKQVGGYYMNLPRPCCCFIYAHLSALRIQHNLTSFTRNVKLPQPFSFIMAPSVLTMWASSYR